MRHDPAKYIFHMLDACQFLLELTADKSIEDYKKDRLLRSAIERELQIIGEALMQLQFRNPQAASEVNEHEKIIRFRHVLVHGYEDIRPDYAWDVITQKLPSLRAELKSLIQQYSLFDQDKPSYMEHCDGGQINCGDWRGDDGKRNRAGVRAGGI